MMDAIFPNIESAPYSLYISKRRPVAAEDENILTTVTGISSGGKPSQPIPRPSSPEKHSRKPEARRIPTATISPISVGMIPMTV